MHSKKQKPFVSIDLLDFLQISADDCIREAKRTGKPMSEMLFSEAEELLSIKKNLLTKTKNKQTTNQAA